MTRMRSLVRIQYLPPLLPLGKMTEKKKIPAKQRKSPIEWIVIFGLGTIFAIVWLYAHWNLSRQPPHHKGPVTLPSSETTPRQP